MQDYHLPIALYDQREQEARLTASYPALRAFSPVAFSQVNFPTRIADESELRRYAVGPRRCARAPGEICET